MVLSNEEWKKWPPFTWNNSYLVTLYIEMLGLVFGLGYQELQLGRCLNF